MTLSDIIHRIKTAPLCTPVVSLGEFVDECGYSRTGWAVWKREGERSWCTCQPARRPRNALEQPK